MREFEELGMANRAMVWCFPCDIGFSGGLKASSLSLLSISGGIAAGIIVMHSVRRGSISPRVCVLGSRAFVI